jgi:Histidine kinase-like ATPase domain
MSAAASNVVNHAYLPIPGDNGAENDGAENDGAENTVVVTLHIEPGAVCVEITDHGTWRSPAGEPDGRGLGIPLMHRLVASVQIDHNGQGTRVLLRQPIPAARSGRPAVDGAAAAGERAVSTTEFDQVQEASSLSRLHAYRVVSAVVSDDHNFDRGVATARSIVHAVLAEHGPNGLAEVTVELSLKLAEALERIAAEQGLAAPDLAEILFVE